jgi:poly(3-hydroxyalkanoate) synthetase
MKEDRDLDMEDYRNLGVMDALKAINSIVPGSKIHTVGYCLCCRRAMETLSLSAIANSQVRSPDRPWNPTRPFRARSIVSCRASSAS